MCDTRPRTPLFCAAWWASRKPGQRKLLSWYEYLQILLKFHLHVKGRENMEVFLWVWVNSQKNIKTMSRFLITVFYVFCKIRRATYKSNISLSDTCHGYISTYLFTFKPWLSITSTPCQVPAGWKHLSILKPWKLELQDGDKVKKGTDIWQWQSTFHSINWIMEIKVIMRGLDYLTHWFD